MVTTRPYGKLIIALIVSAILTLVMTSSAVRAAEPFPVRGTSAVVDTAHIFTPSQFQDLNKRLVLWQQKTKHQLVVVTIPTLDGQDIKTYGYMLGRAWKLGQSGSTDAAILLYSAKEYRLRIEVGLGLEPVLTDAKSLEIIKDIARPKIMARDTAGGLISAANAIMTHIDANEADVIAPTKLTVVDNTNNSNEVTGALLIIAVGLLICTGLFMVHSRTEKRKRLLDRQAARKTPPPTQPNRPNQNTYSNLGSKPSTPSPVRKHTQTGSSSSYNHVMKGRTPGLPRRRYEGEVNTSPDVGGALLGGYVAGRLSEPEEPKYEPRYSAPDDTPTETYGFESNNNDDRGFAGGGADMDCSPSSDSDSSSSDD